MNRRFLAIEVPPAARAALAAATAALRHDPKGLRATEPDGWHVTLAFLGELEPVDGQRAMHVAARTLQRHAPKPAPRLVVRRAARFGDRVLIAQLAGDPAGALEGFVAALQEDLIAAGFRIPARSFRAHITLARGTRRRPVRREDVTALRLPTVSWRPEAIGSWVSEDGAYVVEATASWPSPA